MKNSFISKLLVSVFVTVSITALNGCGGGGGSGGGGSKDATSRPATGYRVFHGSLDSAPLDVVSSDGVLRTVSEFSENSDWVPTAEGNQSLLLKRATTDTTVRAVNFNLTLGQVSSVVFYGDRASFGERVSVIDDTLPGIEGGNSAIRVVHGVFGASQIAASADGQLITSATAIGQASSYLQVPSGSPILRVRRVSDGAVIYQGTFPLQSGSAYTLFISGNVSFYTAGKIFKDS